MPSNHVYKEIFHIVAKRVIAKRESLRELKRFQKMGIEGWLKVEAIAALGDKVHKVRNRGPDLVLEDNIEIELKAATDFNPKYIIEGATKYQTLCLFLGDGSDRNNIEKLRSEEAIKVVSAKIFGDNGNEWIIGIIGMIKARG